MRELAILVLLTASGVTCAAASAVTLAPVVLAPPLQATLEKDFGAEEGPALRSAVSDQLSAVIAQGCGSNPVSIEVIIENAAPSHPTRKQVSENPSLDVIRTRYLGGAQLSGLLRDADGKEIARVAHRYYPPTFETASANRFAWADALLAIGQFADKVATICRDRSRALRYPR